jgi:hypothetical protein
VRRAAGFVADRWEEPAATQAEVQRGPPLAALGRAVVRLGLAMMIYPTASRGLGRQSLWEMKMASIKEHNELMKNLAKEEKQKRWRRAQKETKTWHVVGPLYEKARTKWVEWGREQVAAGRSEGDVYVEVLAHIEEEKKQIDEAQRLAERDARRGKKSG